jgi:hypothetical protein
MTEDAATLRVRVEASIQKFEQELRRARNTGAITTAEIERRFGAMNRRISATSRNAANGLTSVLNVSRAGRFVLQNTAAQIGDMAVQLEAGTSKARVLGQQLPQLLGGFGALGGVLGALAPLLGTIAAIGIPVAAALIAAKGGSDQATDSMDEFTAAVKAMQDAAAIAKKPIRELREEFGIFAEVVQQSAQITAQAAVTDALEVFQGTAAAIRSNIGEVLELSVQLQRLEEAYARIQRQQEQGIATSQQVFDQREALDQVRDAAEAAALGLGLTRDQVLLLELALTSLDKADSMEGIAEGAAEALSLISGIFPETEKIPPEVAKITTELNAVLSAAASAVQAFDQIGGSAASAAASAAELSRNLLTAQRFGAGARFSDEDSVMSQEVLPTAQTRLQQRNAVKRLNKITKPRRRRGGGSASAGQPSISEIAQKEITALSRRIELLGKTEGQIASLNAKYRLLDEAKRRGLDLDARNLKTGETLREEIDRQANSIEQLAEKYTQAKEQAEFFDNMQTRLKDGFLDAIVEGENLSGVLKQLAKDLARAALEAALFNSGPFSSNSGGGGLLGSIFGPLFGGFRAEGGPVSPGKGYIVGEREPEWFFPRSAGTIVPESAMRGSGGHITVNHMWNISANGDDSVRRVVLEQLPMIEERSKAAVVEATRRGEIKI